MFEAANSITDDIGRNAGAFQECGHERLIYTAEYLAYQMDAFTMRALWIQECGP